MRFDKAHPIITTLIAAGSLCIAAGGLRITFLSYKHTVTHDGIPSTPPPALVGTITKPPEKQPEKEPEKSVEQQKPPDLPPVETPKHAPKEEPKPFTFWGYFHTGQGQHQKQGILFQVDRCNVERTLVTCIMTATSAQYDRVLSFDMFTTTITDSDGDVFRPNFRLSNPLQLDRDAPVPFKLEFPVNKDLVKPIVVRLNGFDQNYGNLQNASFTITSK